MRRWSQNTEESKTESLVHGLIRYLKADLRGPLAGRLEAIDGQWNDKRNGHRAEPQEYIAFCSREGTAVTERQTVTQRDPQIILSGALTTLFIQLN